MSEHDDWAEINRLEAENARLRAELAAANARAERHADALNLVSGQAVDYKEALEQMRSDFWAAKTANEQLFKKKTALHSALREAQDRLLSLEDYKLIARIDAVLKGVGDE